MSLGKLKFFRLVAPAIIFLIYLALLGLFTGWWTLGIPNDPEKIMKSTTTLLIGVVYYVFPFREVANQKYFDQVSENLRQKLVVVAGLPDNPAIYTWKSVRGIFFSLVDSDKSLEKKASLAYFNGLIWTTLADARALAIIFVILSLWIVSAGEDRGIVSAFLFAIIWGVTVPLSRAITKKHMEIGDQQIEIIQHNYSEELRKKLDAVRERALGKGN